MSRYIQRTGNRYNGRNPYMDRMLHESRNPSRKLYEEFDSDQEYNKLKKAFDTKYKKYWQIKAACGKYPQLSVQFPEGHNCDAMIFLDDYKLLDAYTDCGTQGETWIEVRYGNWYNAEIISVGQSSGQEYRTQLDLDSYNCSTVGSFVDALYKKFYEI